MANTIDIFNSKIDESKLVGDNKFFNKSEELTEFNKLQQKYISNVDYSNPSNFARFGSAEEYYKNAINYINSEYPYDACTTDKLKWVNSLNEFEYYIYNKEFPRSAGYIYLQNTQAITAYSPFKNIEQSSKDTYQNKNNFMASNKLDFDNGFTFETWAKFDNYTLYSETQLLALTAVSGSNTLGIFNIIKDNSGFLQVGGNQFNTILDFNKWYHIAIVVKSNYSLLYLNGELKERLEFLTPLPASLNKYTFSELGLFCDDSNPIDYIKTNVFTLGSGNSVSLDECRFWNGEKSTEDIGRYWFTSIDGNDFTDPFNNNLLFYYKFNEGWDDQYGLLCLDYSGHQNDAEIIDYSPTCRITGSAFDLSGIVQDKEPGDIILKGISFSSTVQEYYNNKISSGKEYDYFNIHSLYNKFPSWILQQEEEKNIKHLKQIIQIVSSYFDDLYNKIKESSDYKTIKNNTDKDNLYPFYDKILTSTGFDVTDLFSGLDTIEKISSRNDTTLFDEDIQKIKNAIFQNIYNNLSYILKSKGTEKSIKSFLRSYGVNEQLVRINLYSDGAEYNAVDRSKQTVVRKKSLNLVGRSLVSTEQMPDIIENAFGYDDKINYYTLEIATSFDNSLTSSQPLTSSIFGVKSAGGNAMTSDLNGIRYFFIVTVENDQNLGSRFVLTDISSSATASSPYYKNLYDNNIWNLALRKKPTVDTLFGQTGSLEYVIDLYGVNKNSHFEQEFSCSMPILKDPGILNYYIGCNWALETMIPTYMDIFPANSKFYYCNFWTDYLNNETITAHNKEILSYGVDE